MLVYYKFYYIGFTNWYVTNVVSQYSFILLLKCHLIDTSIYKFFVVKFVISLEFSPPKKIKKELIKIQSPLSVWKMLKLIQILGKTNYKLMWQ